MKYCTNCGQELSDDAVFCPGCGCPASARNGQQAQAPTQDLLQTLSQRVFTNGIIWIVIGTLQILLGILTNWFFLIVGVLNIISSVNDLNYSKSMKENPSGIVAKFEPITAPIIVLVYNLLIGGVFGVIGSIYYFVAIRSYVMENKAYFASFDVQNQ